MFVFSKGRVKTFNPICDRKNIHAGDERSHRIVRLPNGDMLKKTHDIKPIGEYGIRFNVWSIPPFQNEHPAPFPEALARDHILSWSNEGDVVLDPFSGSGTTAKMAKHNGRRYIGIEVNPEYVELSEQRLLQGVLF